VNRLIVLTTPNMERSIMATDTDIPISFLRQCFDIDAEAGMARWRFRPDMPPWWNTRYAGSVVGTPDGQSYLCVMLAFSGRKRLLKVHRIIWALAHDRWPPEDYEVDHRNGVHDDNRISNLREATDGQNQHNRKVNANNKSGYPGVSWNKQSGKWVAQIAVDGRHIHRGYFDDDEEAFMAVCDAKAKLHPFQPEFRDMTMQQAAVEARAWFRRRAWREIV
jgi:hypothetical protein